MVIVVSALLLAPSFATPDPIPPVVKPSHPLDNEATPMDLPSPQAAFDGSTFSGSGMSETLHCKLDGLSPIERTTTWYGFPEDWIPDQLEVKFRASSNFIFYFPQTHGEVKAKIEYSLDGGGSWDLIEPEYVSTDQSPAADIANGHVAYVTNLADDLDPTQIRVRATLLMRLTSCNNFTVEASHLAASFYVQDIRLKVKPPILTVSPEIVTRGEFATFRVVGAPGSAISQWKFTGDNVGGPIERVTQTNSMTWQGTIADAGVGSVRVVIAGQAYTPTKRLDVQARTTFMLPAVAATEQLENGFACVTSTGTVNVLLPVPPTATPHALGRYCLELQALATPGRINDNGPNHDVRFVLSVENTNNTRYRWIINPDLRNTNCQFHINQNGSYDQVGNPSGFISGANLKTNAERHERGASASHHAQYTAAMADPSKNPGAGVEAIVSRGVTEIAFMSGVTAAMSIRNSAVEIATNSPEPLDGQHTAGGQFQGHVNYASYPPCS